MDTPKTETADEQFAASECYAERWKELENRINEARREEELFVSLGDDVQADAAHEEVASLVMQQLTVGEKWTGSAYR